MIAKKMSIFNFKIDKPTLLKGLNEFKFTEITGQNAQSLGFVAVSDDDENNYKDYGDVVRFKLRIDSRKVPGSAVKAELKKRIEDITAREGYKPGRKQQREIKEQILDELIVKALVQQSFMQGWFDFKAGLLVVDDVSPGRLDSLFGAMFKSCDDMKIAMVKTNMNPATMMTLWVSEGEVPEWLSLDDCAKFEFPEGGKASVTSVNITDPRISNLISMRAQVVELGVTLQDKVSVLLASNFSFKKIKHVESEEGAVCDEDMESADRADTFLNVETARMLKEKFTLALGGEMALMD